MALIRGKAPPPDAISWTHRSQGGYLVDQIERTNLDNGAVKASTTEVHP